MFLSDYDEEIAEQCNKICFLIFSCLIMDCIWATVLPDLKRRYDPRWYHPSKIYLSTLALNSPKLYSTGYTDNNNI